VKVIFAFSSLVQLYVEKALLDEAQPGGFDTIKATIDVGDIVGVSGGVKRTDKGELSVMVAHVQASEYPGADVQLWDVARYSGRNQQHHTLCSHMLGSRAGNGWLATFHTPDMQVLTKSLLPLPDKWHGLTDIEKRYR
jgi:lysyl-tRNA synthetase class 2